MVPLIVFFEYATETLISFLHPSWQVDLLKHGIPDPSLLTSSLSQSSNIGPEKDGKDKVQESGEYMATPVFVHTK